MNTNAVISNKDSIIENISKTLLYEGYSLFPYHRSAIKNQKPIPFGVVYPNRYTSFHINTYSAMQTDCIVNANENSLLNITVRFLHLKKILVRENTQYKNDEDNFVAVADLNINGKAYQSGWQTIERRIDSGDLIISRLIKESKKLNFDFEKEVESYSIFDENNLLKAKQDNSILAIKGFVSIKASSVENMPGAYRIKVTIENNTPVDNAEEITRDEVLCQSFLSTHTILNISGGEFISIQNPGEEWKPFIEQCENKGAWPILIEESNTSLLSSPIIIYDYPQINPQSHGDLFDSLEIEEALMLHFSVMSDKEKNRIAQSDDKLRSMLNKVSQVTPEEIINLHGGFSDVQRPTIHNTKE